jgi:hypothetical protein
MNPSFTDSFQCEVDDSLRFTLKYRGELRSNQAKKGSRKIGHAIRRNFHPQIQHRWVVTPELRIWAQPPHNWRLPIREKSIRKDWYQKRMGNYLFVPLVIVSDSRPLVCELDIRILWRAAAGNLLLRTDDGIDLDNRVSVLLDALTIPQQNQLLTDEPVAGEERTFCLLEDDRLVTKLTVSAEPLTSAPEPDEKPNFADVSIEVLVRRGDGYEVPFGDF